MAAPHGRRYEPQELDALVDRAAHLAVTRMLARPPSAAATGATAPAAASAGAQQRRAPQEAEEKEEAGGGLVVGEGDVVEVMAGYEPPVFWRTNAKGAKARDGAAEGLQVRAAAGLAARLGASCFACGKDCG